MDQRLFKAARLGDIVALNTLLEEDPLILEKVSLSPTSETPLHIAALAGKTDFAKEMIRMMPSFAWQLNQDSFNPMHMASARGNIEIVKELLTRISPELCLVKDKRGRTPLHYAAIQGRVLVIEELLSHYPKAIEVVTARGESALHLAVKNNQFEALRILVERLENLDNYGELINAKDKEGKTILELAISTKQLQVVDLLHGKENLLGLVQVNAAADSESQEIVGGIDSMSQASGTDMGITASDPMPPLQQADQSTQKKLEENKSNNYEKAILVVASLIATVTYQAGLSPPPSIWKKGMKLDTICNSHPSKLRKSFPSLNSFENACPTGYFYLFMSFNTAGFFSSILLIMLYRTESTAQVLLPTSLLCMMVTYITLAMAILPNGLSFLIIYLITIFILGYCAFTFQVSRKLAKRLLSVASMRKPPPVDVSRVDA